MGVDYCLSCVKCHEKLEEFDGEDHWTEDEYDEAWEKLYEKIDASCGFSWGKVNVKRLSKWINIHKEHGDIEFTAQ